MLLWFLHFLDYLTIIILLTTILLTYWLRTYDGPGATHSTKASVYRIRLRPLLTAEWWYLLYPPHFPHCLKIKINTWENHNWEKVSWPVMTFCVLQESWFDCLVELVSVDTEGGLRWVVRLWETSLLLLFIGLIFLPLMAFLIDRWPLMSSHTLEN